MERINFQEADEVAVEVIVEENGEALAIDVSGNAVGNIGLIA